MSAPRTAIRVSDKLAMMDRIAVELQSRYGFREIDMFFNEFGVDTPDPYGDSKRLYAKQILSGVDFTVVTSIADDLGIGTPAEVRAQLEPPAAWRGTADFRLFISHVSTAKDRANRLKICLAPYAICGFVAHDDIEPTAEWQDQVESALYAADALVSVLTPGFSKSTWAQQEVGFALGRGIKVISLKMGEDPSGFLAKHQALLRQRRRAEEIAKEIDALLEADPRTTERLSKARFVRDEIPF